MAILTTEATDRTDRITDAIRERVGSTGIADRITPSEPGAAERVAATVDQARGQLADALDDLADRFGGDRLLAELQVRRARARSAASEAGERLSSYFDDIDIDEETARVWAPRIAFAFAGFLLGLLIGRASSRRRSDDDIWLDEPVTTSAPRGVAQAPRTQGVSAAR